MVTVRFWTKAALLALPLTACDNDGLRMQAAVYENNGTLCLLQEGGRVSIYALSGACGCSNIRTATCATVVEEDRIVVTSRTLIVTNTGADINCPDGCYMESALCSGESPGEGRYEVTYGPEQGVVELPLRGPLQLFGRHPSSSCDDLVEALATNPAFEQDAAP